MNDPTPIEEYEAYLGQFGEDGLFSKLAQIRIERIRASMPQIASTLFADNGRNESLSFQRSVRPFLDSLPGYHIWGSAIFGAVIALVFIVKFWPTLRLDEVEPSVGPAKEIEVNKSKIQSNKGLKVGVVFRDCGACPEMIVIPTGSFIMGADENTDIANSFGKPAHRVTFHKPFAAGRYEVTYAEWSLCVLDQGCEHDPEEEFGDVKLPISNISWSDAKQYVHWLSETTGSTYRLLSEAEWEYIARAGTVTDYSFGDGISTSQANFDESIGRTTHVGFYQPNEFGIYDTHGNVFEWVEDCWNKSYSGAPVDGSAWITGDCVRRVLRGGSWSSPPSGVTSYVRIRDRSNTRNPILGFRVARAISE